jgi:N-acetylglucosamine-6-sulfatase
MSIERSDPSCSEPRAAEVDGEAAMTVASITPAGPRCTSEQLSRRCLLRASLMLGMAPLGASSIGRGTAAKTEQEASDPAVEASRSPDIVVVVTDDMRSTDWQALPQTQELLGSKGVTFPNFFVTTPACSPSRTSILTGLHAHEHGVWLGDDKDKDADINGASVFETQGLPSRTIAVALQNAGYRTALVGKYLNGFGFKQQIPLGWDAWYSTSSTRYVDFELNENGVPVEYRGEDQYGTDVLAARAIETITATPADQPLFLYFAPKAPHGPSTPASRHLDAFQGARVEGDPSVNENDVSEKPAFLRKRSIEPAAALNAKERLRLQSLLAVDEAIVQIVDALVAAGRFDRTYIFVLSDNGYAMGQHRWSSKALPYDTVTRIPMIAFGPMFDSGVVDQRLVTNCDIAPTLVELSGATLGGMSGQSLLSEDERTVVLLENRPAATVPYRALRSKDWLYVEWDSGERELYDYRTDPFELDNVLAEWEGHSPSPADLDRAEILHERLAVLSVCTGSECRSAEQAPLDA